MRTPPPTLNAAGEARERGPKNLENATPFVCLFVCLFVFVFSPTSIPLRWSHGAFLFRLFLCCRPTGRSQSNPRHLATLVLSLLLLPLLFVFCFLDENFSINVTSSTTSVLSIRPTFFGVGRGFSLGGGARFSNCPVFCFVNVLSSDAV